MKIIGLKSENFKGIKAIEITPDANFQIISGANGQGKSSVMDALWAAIQGKEALKDTDKPIHEGQSKAFVTVNLGDIIVTRKWSSNDKSTLEVTTKEGAKFPSPQAMLDDLIGKLSFDPLAFANQDDKKQKALLQELVGINFDKIDLDRKGHCEERTLHNSAAKKLEGALSELPYPKEDTPLEEVSASDIIKQLTEAQRVIRQNEDSRRTLNNLRQNANGAKSEITELEERLRVKKLAYDAMVTEGKTLGSLVESLIDPDTTAIQNQLENVETINKQVVSAAKYRRLQAEIKEYKESSEYCTKKITDIDQLKIDMLQGATFPIEGLGFDDNGVTYNNIPLKQCCDSEEIKVSVSIAMAMNPKLKVIRMKNGSLLDSKNLEMIKGLALENDYQIWVEIVDESGKMGVVIEDGQIKEA